MGWYETLNNRRLGLTTTEIAYTSGMKAAKTGVIHKDAQKFITNHPAYGIEQTIAYISGYNKYASSEAVMELRAAYNAGRQESTKKKPPKHYRKGSPDEFAYQAGIKATKQAKNPFSSMLPFPGIEKAIDLRELFPELFPELLTRQVNPNHHALTFNPQWDNACHLYKSGAAPQPAVMTESNYNAYQAPSCNA